MSVSNLRRSDSADGHTTDNTLELYGSNIWQCTRIPEVKGHARRFKMLPLNSQGRVFLLGVRLVSPTQHSHNSRMGTGLFAHKTIRSRE